MTDVDRIFARKALVSHVIAGYPSMRHTAEMIRHMSIAGVDMVIVEIPFSDPAAGGPEVQSICSTALSEGVTTDSIFDMLRDLRGDCDVPVAIMTYYNPVFRYGKGRFVSRCLEAGVGSLIVPDMPLEERPELDGLCRSEGVTLVAMVAPSYPERIGRVLDSAEGYVYIMGFKDLAGFPEGFVSDPREIAEMAHARGLKCITDSGVGDAREILGFADGAIDGNDVMALASSMGEDCIQFIEDHVRGVRARI